MSETAERKAERILVVDDSRDVRDFLVQYVLAPRGYEVLVAADGLEGLQKAVSQLPDLMIVDVQMPFMNGLELLRRLRQRHLTIPAILATAHGSEQVAVEAFRLGVRDYVIKPFIIEEIQEIVERALRESRLEGERDQLLQQLTESNRRLRQRAQELNALYGIGKSVSSSLQLEKVLERVVEAAVYLSDAEEGAIILVDERRGDLYVRAAKNIRTVMPEIRLGMDSSIAGRVLRNKQTAILNQWDLTQPSSPTDKSRSYVYIPMIARGRALGVLAVANRAAGQPFDNREARVLSALASYAAIAINNATLYDQSVKERNQLRTIINQIEDPVLVVDDKAQVVLVNEASRRVLYLPEGDLTGQPVGSLIRNVNVLEFLLQPAGPDMSRKVNIAASDERMYDVGLTPIASVGRSMVMHDITQLEQLNQLKSDIVSSVSHDLRSPLTSILGYVELLERAGPLNEMQAGFVDRVRESVSKITTLITELLDVGRLEEGSGLTLEVCWPGEILKSVADAYRLPLQKKKQKLDWQVDRSLVVMGDPNRLYQAFSNVLSNANKYTPEGGQISVHAHKQERQIVIEIADTGSGIDAADMGHVFNKYYRGKNTANDYSGTGLGLFIVKSVVDLHQGRIWLESEPGRGTKVFILLPLAENTGAESELARSSIG